MYNKKIKKRGLSPVITNLLLVGLVIIIIGLIFIWFKGMVEEGITKFDKNIKLVCDDVVFQASYSSEGYLTIQNNGVPPIYTMNIKELDQGEFITKDIIMKGEKWPTKGLKQGEIYSELIDFGSTTQISLAPVLVGINSHGKQMRFTCGGQYEQKIDL